MSEKIPDRSIEFLYFNGVEALEIERVCLSFVLWASSHAVELSVSDLAVLPEHFANTHHGAIWGQISTIVDEGLPLTPVTVISALVDSRSEALETWPSIIGTPLPTVPSSWVKPFLAWISARIRRAYFEKETVRASHDYAQAVVDRDAAAQREARERIEECNTANVQTEALEADAAIIKTIDLIESNALNNKELIPTGIELLDRKTGGFLPGELWIIGARPSQGKTALALNMFDAASAVQRCHFISLEMTLEQLVARWNVMYSGIDMNKLMSGRNYTNQDLTALRMSFDRIRHHAVAINDDQRLGELETLRLEVISAARKGAHVIFIDYLQLITAAAKDRRLEIDLITRTLKRLAMQHQIAIVALAQLNRGSDGKVPAMGDLKESSAIEQDADKIILIDRPNKGEGAADPEEEAFLIVAKQRNGETGTCPVVFNPTKMQFTQGTHRRE